MQIGYVYGLGAATPGSYECFVFPSTPGCPPKPATPTAPTTPTPATSPSIADYWGKIPTWVKILGGAAIAYVGYRKFVAKK